jgi:hypothetical protein
MKTVHRCGKCRHIAAEHALPGSCSHGYCPCLVEAETVEAENPSEEIPTWPGYDHATGKWAQR